jgi:hypothetical protein
VPEVRLPDWVARTDSYFVGRKCEVSLVVTCQSLGPARLAAALIAISQITITRHGFRAAASEIRPSPRVGWFIMWAPCREGLLGRSGGERVLAFERRV